MNQNNEDIAQSISELNQIIKNREKTPKFSLKGMEGYGAITKNYDGDTIWVIVKLYGTFFRFSCRMYGYNSAELRSKSEDEVLIAKQSKDKLAKLILNKVVFVKFENFDKYGRPLVNVYQINKKGIKKKESVNEIMIRTGFGKPYFGTGEKKY